MAAILARGPIADFFAPEDAVANLAARLLVIVGLTLPLAGYVYLLDGVLIGAGDGPYLAKAGMITLAVYAPAAFAALLAEPGVDGLTWLWIGFTVGFMGARAATLGLRARSDGWMKLGA